MGILIKTLVPLSRRLCLIGLYISTEARRPGLITKDHRRVYRSSNPIHMERHSHHCQALLNQSSFIFTTQTIRSFFHPLISLKTTISSNYSNTIESSNFILHCLLSILSSFKSVLSQLYSWFLARFVK